MIARVWHGIVPKAKAGAYLRLMQEVAIPDYKMTAGNRAAWCLTRLDGDIVHFEMLTFWEDVDAIKTFAGEQYELAKYYEFDSEFLLEKEPLVRHSEIHESQS